MTTPASDHAPERAPATDDRLFFAERLPAGAESESPSDTESRVVLDLETGSPLPLDRLAYGWVRLPSRDILYYAGPKERVPPHDPFAPAGTVVPPVASVVLPDGVNEQDFAKAARGFYADLRPRPELSEMRVRAAADSLLSKLRLPLILLAILAFLLAGGAGVLSAMNTVTRHRLDTVADEVKEARTRADMLATIDRMEAAGHSVFDALAVVNPSRPEGVTFTKVAFSGNRELLLDGRAPDAGSITRMDDALHKTGFFSGADQPRIETSNGRSTFHLRLGFNKWPTISDAAGAVPTTPVTEAPSSPTEITAPSGGGNERSFEGGFRGGMSRRRGSRGGSQ